MTDEQVLAMPSRRFWAMWSQITRVEAHESQSQIQIGIASQSSEQCQKIQERLSRDIGEVTWYELKEAHIEEPEDNWLSKLKAL